MQYQQNDSSSFCLGSLASLLHAYVNFVAAKSIARLIEAWLVCHYKCSSYSIPSDNETMISKKIYIGYQRLG